MRKSNLINHTPVNAVEVGDDALQDEIISTLKASAENISVCQPPTYVWQKITNELAQEQQRKPRSIIWQFAIAASVFVSLSGVLVWNHYTLQKDFEQVLASNQLLEEQLLLNSLPALVKVGLLEALRDIDIQLYRAQSQKEKMALLKLRKETIEAHLRKSEQGNKYEFSI